MIFCTTSTPEALTQTYLPITLYSVPDVTVPVTITLIAWWRVATHGHNHGVYYRFRNLMVFGIVSTHFNRILSSFAIMTYQRWWCTIVCPALWWGLWCLPRAKVPVVSLNTYVHVHRAYILHNQNSPYIACCLVPGRLSREPYHIRKNLRGSTNTWVPESFFIW